MSYASGSAAWGSPDFIYEDALDEQAEREMDEPACEDSEDGSDADENTEPDDGWIETLTRVVEVLEAMQQRGWDFLREKGCVAHVRWLVTHLVNNAEAFLAAQCSR